MKKIIPILFIACALTSCSLVPVQKMDIEQGNFITQENVNKLHLGMTTKQVKEIMGTPELLNTFTANRVDYVYTNEPGNRTRVERSLVLTFYKKKLTNIYWNMR